MWLVALQNEGNSSQLYISIYFPKCLVFSFGGSEFTFLVHLFYICKQNSSSQLKHSSSYHSHPPSLHVRLSSFESLELKLTVKYLLCAKSNQLFSALSVVAVHTPVFKTELLVGSY